MPRRSIVIALVLLAGACPESEDRRGHPRAEIGGAGADVDHDGVADAEDGDLDGDGVPNAADLDIDGDGVRNEDDGDIDGDGVANEGDDTPWGVNPDGADGAYADPDGDGVPNGADDDDDGDGVPDGVEGQGDCDGDGVPEDESADCDGFCIEVEAGLVPCDDGSPPGSGAPDLDGDGVPDSIDGDDDADGVPDDVDHQPGGADPCVGIEGPPPAACLPDDPGDDDDDGDVPTDPPGDTSDPPPDDGGEGDEGDDTSDPGPSCTTESFDPQAPIPPRILLVVDRSGSMDEPAPGFDDSKWIATREALVGPLFGSDAGVVGQLEDHVEIGLLTYPADDADDVCAEGQLVRDVRLENHASIKTALYFTDPAGATPTAASLAQAEAVLDALPDEGGQRAIILATDGGPNCNRSLDGDTCRCVGDPEQCRQFPANCLDDANSIAASSALNAAGYPVYVLGINGSEDFSDVLSAMAQAGGTNDFIPVSSSATLAAAIEGIATQVGSCRFDLSGFPDETTLTVRVDGTVIAHDDARANGWDLVGPSTVELFGTACDAALDATTSITVERCE